MDELMIPIYARKVRQGQKELDEVPARIRDRVRDAYAALVAADESQASPTDPRPDSSFHGGSFMVS